MSSEGRRNNTLFCLESKIRHSTIVFYNAITFGWFCLESKIRHSTIENVQRRIA